VTPNFAAVPIGMTREASTFRAHPLLERRHQRRDPDLSYREPLRGGQAVDLSLDIEDRIDPAHGLDRQWRFREISQHEQFASPMCPTRRFDDRGGSARLVVQVVEPGISIRLKYARVTREMPARMHPSSIA
jgi:hypothetical protein